MSTIKSYDSALDFYPEAPRPSLTRFGRGLQRYWRGLREGLSAARSYEELMRRGVPHDKAVHQVFDEHFRA